MSKLENTIPGYKYLAVEPYTPNIGATINEVDLAEIGNDGLRAELRKVLFAFQVLFFRKQTLTPEQQVDVARIFGDPDKAKAFFPRHTAQKAIELIETRPVGHRYVTDQWHADITFSPNPPTGTVLYSHVIPASGGDTLLSAIDADVIKTYVSLELGIGVVASVAYDEEQDRGLRLIRVPELFPASTTRIAVCRGTYLRSYAHAFIEKICPDIREDVLKAAIKPQQGPE